MDHQVASNNRLTFKSIISAQPAFQPLPAATVPGFGTTQDFKSRILSLTDTHIFTPSLLNEARLGFSRLTGVVLPETQIPLSAVGMRRFNAQDFPDIPQIAVTGAFSIGYSVNADQGVNQNTFHWTDTLSWTPGRHQIRAGLEARRYQDNYYSNNRMRGTVTIPSFGDFLVGLSGNRRLVRACNGLGGAGRKILRGPAQRNLDLSLNKLIPITDRVGLQWRTEFFNAFNIANFANPGGSITASSNGVIRSTTGNPRVILKLVF